MEQQRAVDYVLALAREHRQSDVDLFLQRGEELTIRVFKGRVEKVDQASTGCFDVAVRPERTDRFTTVAAFETTNMFEHFSVYPGK